MNKTPNNDLTVQDVQALYREKIVECPKLKRVSKEQQRQQILPTLQEQIDNRQGQLTLFC